MTVTAPAPGTPLTDAERAAVEANVRLVNWVVARHFPGLEYEEAVADGMLGLIRAVQCFDPERGKFSTYAIYWIRQAVLNGIETRNGVNYRRAKRQGGDYDAPLSIDRVDDCERSILATLIASDDPESEVVSTASASDLMNLMTSACGDQLDRAALESLVTDCTIQEVADRRGLDYERVRVRRQRIRKVLHGWMDVTAS